MPSGVIPSEAQDHVKAVAATRKQPDKAPGPSKGLRGCDGSGADLQRT